GVGRPEWLEPVAGALARLGAKHSLGVHGRGGLDEVSLSAPTDVWEVRGSALARQEWHPGDLGLEGCALGELQVSGPQESAARIRDILPGAPGPPPPTAV